MSTLFSYDDFDTPRLATQAEQYRQSPKAVGDATKNVGRVIRGLTDTAQQKGSLAGGLRAVNSNTAQSRMALPLADVGKSGASRFGNTSNTPKPSSDDNYNKNASSDLSTRQSMWNQDLAAKNAIGNQDINLNIRRMKEYEPLANNEKNRALGMDLKTKFPYMQYETETASGREIMNNAQQAIPTFLNRATASRLNPVSMSL